MEEFRDIEGYEGLYQVSNDGNVKSLNYNRTGEEKLLKPAANRGYLFVVLCKDGKMKKYQVHRLVASAFIKNPEGLNEVNHIDECKTNNCVDNLEWCSHAFNINYGTRNQRVAETQRGVPRPYVGEALTNRPDQSIPIDMITKDGELVRTFPSSHEAERWLRENGFPKAAQTHIIQCCKGKLQSCYGFKWRYAQGN